MSNCVFYEEKETKLIVVHIFARFREGKSNVVAGFAWCTRLQLETMHKRHEEVGGRECKDTTSISCVPSNQIVGLQLVVLFVSPFVSIT